MRLWEKYFLKELIKSFFLFLIIFYGLYVLIDYASHTSGANYHHTRLKPLELLIHYGCEFLVRAEILVPFALLISSVKLLCKLNANNEIVALLAAGYSKKRLITPLLVFALLITALMYLNLEVTFPKATKRLQKLDEKYVREKPAKNAKPIVHHLVLEDGSLLLFKQWNTKEKQFEEVFWIRSINELWKIGELNPYATPPKGYAIDRLKRSNEGELTLAFSAEQADFSDMRFNKKRLIDTIIPPEELSISELYTKRPRDDKELSEKESLILSAFYRKLAMPWLPLLVVLGVVPSCMFFSRHLPLFFIYAGSIFGLVAVYLIINAASVLGERQVLDPLVAIFTPFIALFLLLIVRFLLMK